MRGEKTPTERTRDGGGATGGISPMRVCRARSMYIFCFEEYASLNAILEERVASRKYD